MASRGVLLAGVLVAVLGGACGENLGQELCEAVGNADRNKTAQLLRGGADPNVVCERCASRAPLHIAALKGIVRISVALLEHGAQVNERDIFGMMPLDDATQQGHALLVQALLSHGARNTNGMTPLHYAAWLGQTDVVQAHLKRGDDPEARDHQGRTVLHQAAMRGHFAVVEVLLSDSAVDPLARDYGGETPAELAMTPENTSVAELLRTHGGAEPAPTSLGSWVHVLQFHPRKVAACAGVGVLLAGLKTTLEWVLSRRVIATQASSYALVGELVPSVGALRLAAEAIVKDRRCGSLVDPTKLLANSFAVVASLLFVCGPCMWLVKPLYIAMFAGPAFLVPALWIFGWQEVVNFPVLVIVAKTPTGRCRIAVTSLLLGLLSVSGIYVRSVGNWTVFRGVSFSQHLSVSVGVFAWWGGLEVPTTLGNAYKLLVCVLVCAALWQVLAVAVTAPRCCRLPVLSRAAVEDLARDIDRVGAAGELPQLHPKLQPEGLLSIAGKTGFAALDFLTDLNTIGTFIVTYNFWFAGVLWTVFLASLGSELAKGNIQTLPGELKRTLATGVMTERLIDLLDTDKGFEAPFSLAITIYAMPFAAHNGNTFLLQCFSVLTSTIATAGFISNHLTQATLADQPDVDESGTSSSESDSEADSDSDTADSTGTSP